MSADEWIPRPLISSSKEWREQAGRYRLEGSKCKECGEVYFPKRWSCPKCHSMELQEICLKPSGTIVEATIGYGTAIGWEGFYPMQGAIIRLDDGPLIAGEIIGMDGPIKPGTPVKLVIRKIGRDTLGANLYGFKFVPAATGKDSAV